MNLAQQVRASYEQRPYPAVSTKRRLRPVWRIPPLEWLDAMCRRNTPPRRVLVAGCGTGNEAFALRERLPEAEIVAADFSPRSLRIARKLRPRSRIAFCEADLMARDFHRSVGGEFDLITCHGVLSYIPAPQPALQNLRRALAPGGVLYLGVNGAAHRSETWRPALREFGVDPVLFTDTRQLRDVLRLFDAVLGGGAGLAEMPAEYLAGDLFGPFIANHPLQEWVDLARDCGLHFRGSFAAHRQLRPILNRQLHEQLLPRSRAAVHLLVEQLAPVSFHPVVFTRETPPETPWAQPEALLRCRFVPTGLYRNRLPRRMAAGERRFPVVLESLATNTAADLQLPRWLIELLRSGDEQLPLGDRLRLNARRVSPASLRWHLYLLELLGAANVVPE